jgi:plastocyanin
MRRFVGVVAVFVLVLTACGNGGGSTRAAGGGEVRTVLVDYKHDQFSSSFFRYYPKKVTVRPGDTVRFKQSWTGEPHSVTAGSLAQDLLEVAPLIKQYSSKADAVAKGAPADLIAKASQAFAKVPPMTGQGPDVYQPGAKPCYVASVDAVPVFVDQDKNQPDPKAVCPTDGKPQPAFNGRQALYNSGFIPYEGDGGNTFDVPIAKDATSGVFTYFCNYHWVEMTGVIEIVGKNVKIPSQSAVSKQAQQEIAKDAVVALKNVRDAKAGRVGALKLPLAGRETEKDIHATAINEFFPQNPTAKVGEKITWTLDGNTHTVSFNVPKYFPLLTVQKNRSIYRNPNGYQAVGWAPPPEAPPSNDPNGPPPTFYDVGSWDGSGGFHSSGGLDPGSTFSVTFTKAGTYLFACVLHPHMVGTLKVTET